MALVGIYKIKDTAILFQCLEHLFIQHVTSYSEYVLTDALDCMIRRGRKFQSFKVKNWFDCGKKETLLESNTTLLKKYGGTVDANILSENSIIIPPVSIGSGCKLKNSIIGPMYQLALIQHLNILLSGIALLALIPIFLKWCLIIRLSAAMPA
jgi:glucose-1-phosphate thymidylyltransferase